MEGLYEIRGTGALNKGWEGGFLGNCAAYLMQMMVSEYGEENIEGFGTAEQHEERLLTVVNLSYDVVMLLDEGMQRC